MDIYTASREKSFKVAATKPRLKLLLNYRRIIPMDETVGLGSGSWCKRNQGLSNDFEVYHYSITLKYLLYMSEGSGGNVIIPRSFTL